MEGRVPGGRKKSTAGEEFPLDDDNETLYTGATTDRDTHTGIAATATGPGTAKLTAHHKRVSQSLPKFAADPRKMSSIPDDLNRSHTLDRSLTLDRKRRLRPPSFKSFGSFMNRMVRHMSQVSLHSSPKVSKKRSTSMNRGEYRYLPNSKCEDLSRPEQKQQNVLKFDKNRIPGAIGLRNHGNTCFMNAVIQCLSHSELLVEYFITDQYKNDIKRNNKQNAKKFGTKGELTEHLAMLLKSLWTCQYTPDLSNDFKSVVGKYGSQYRGYAQHDAQEFLMWLLDKVHEDLNIATKKKYRANKSSVGRADEAVAAEALANHMRCNNSFVYDLFQALYRSSLTCPNCRRQSNTFDPFLSVSLPIPQKLKRPVYVTVVYQDAQPKQVRIGLLMNQLDSVKELRQTLAADTKIPVTQLILTEIYYDGFHRTFHDSQPVTDIRDTDNIYAIETPAPVNVPPASSSANGTAASQYTVANYVMIVVLNKVGSGAQERRFGGPMVLQVQQDCNFLDLQRDILQNMMGMLREGIIAQKMGVLFKLRVVDGPPGKCYLPHDVDHPLFTSAVDRALSACIPGGGPAHFKLLVEWDQQTKQCMIANSDNHIDEHTSVKQVKLAHEQPVLGTLDECFELYTQEEKLSGDDAWHCASCKKRQQGTVKSLSLWSLPDILVIHLKRFKQIGLKRTKLNTLITFPVTGLDMSAHVTKRNNHTNNHGYKSTTGWSPWRPSRRSPTGPEDFIYDLYAVCNHYGNMQGGHYTAFCKNPTDDKWYTFDDTKVTERSSEELVTREAYLLFYHRRTMHRSGNTVNDPQHWIHRLPNVHFDYDPGVKASPVSKSHEALLEDEGSLNDTAFSRIEAYATLRTPSRARSHTAPPSPDHVLTSILGKDATSPHIQAAARDVAAGVNALVSESETNATTPLAGYGVLASPGTPHLASRRQRSATVPQVLPSPVASSSSGSEGRRESKDMNLSNVDYSKTLYLQESCV